MSFLRYSVLIVIFNISTLVAFNSAIEYYDAASQTYILESNIKGAKKYINDGLTVFPNDTLLTKLGSVIKEEEEKQNNNKNNQDQQNKDNQNQDQNKDQNQQDKKDQEKKDDKKQENQDQQKEQQQKEQQQQAQQDESKQDMKKEEAKRLIELYADDADSLNKPQKKANTSKSKIQKDW